MLVGDPPFTGSSVQAIVARIITEHPTPPQRSRDTIPEFLDAAVLRALAKLPADRFGSAHEFANALGGKTVGQSPAAASTRSVAARLPRGRSLLPWALAALGALGTAGLGWKLLRPPAPSAVPARFDIVVPNDSNASRHVAGLAVSPDGRRLAIAVDHGPALMRAIDSLAAAPIPATEGAQNLFFSVDGRWLITLHDHKLRRRPAGGGPIDELVAAEWGAGELAPDATLYFTPSYKSGLFRLRAGAGAPEPLTLPDTSRRELGHWNPQLLPDGQTILFTNFSLPLSRSRIELLSLGSLKRTVLFADGYHARYADGLIVFARGGTLFAVRFDAQHLRPLGQPAPVLDDVIGAESSGEPAFALAADGTLFYAPASTGDPPRQLVWVDRHGTERRVLDRQARYVCPSLSPSGDRLAVQINENGFGDIWAFEIQRGTITRLTSHEASSVGPAWARDGLTVYYSLETPVFEVFRRAADAATPEELVLESREDQLQIAPSADGKSLFVSLSSSTGQDVALVTLGPPAKTTPLLTSSADEVGARLSPNGRWLAYKSNESGRGEVYLRSYPDLARVRRQVSTGGGQNPHWTRGGREVVYDHDGRLMAVAVDPVTGQPGAPAALFGQPTSGSSYDLDCWDVTPDGERFLFAKSPPAPALNVAVILNWTRAVRERLKQ